MLNKLITTYPKFITSKWGFDNKEVESEIFLELLNRFNQLFLVKKIKITAGHQSFINKNYKHIEIIIII